MKRSVPMLCLISTPLSWSIVTAADVPSPDQVASPAGIAPTISGGGTVAAFVDIESGRPDFQKNVVEVANKSPELMKLLEEHHAAQERYEALYEQMHSAEPDKP